MIFGKLQHCYIRQVNGVKLADILLSLLCACAHSLGGYSYALSERLLVIPPPTVVAGGILFYC